MKRSLTICSSEFEEQARKTVSLAYILCEERLKANKGDMTHELEVLAAAALSLEKVVAVFIAAERLCK